MQQMGFQADAGFAFTVAFAVDKGVGIQIAEAELEALLQIVGGDKLIIPFC